MVCLQYLDIRQRSSHGDLGKNRWFDFIRQSLLQGDLNFVWILVILQSSTLVLDEYMLSIFSVLITKVSAIQYIPRNMHTVFALLCFVVVIHWLIFPYPSGLFHWLCGNLTIAPVPAKQTWWICINTSCEFIINDCITTTKQSTTKPCAYFLGYTVNNVNPLCMGNSSHNTNKPKTARLFWKHF